MAFKTSRRSVVPKINYFKASSIPKLVNTPQEDLHPQLLTIKSYRLLSKQSTSGSITSPHNEKALKARNIKARSVCVIRDAAQSKDLLFKARESLIKELSSFINSSNGLIVNLAEGQSCYKYYLGPGNNSALVNKYFSCRPWWVRVEESQVKEANLVWTQGKVADFLKNIKTSHKQDRLVDHELIGKSITCQDIFQDVTSSLKSLDISTLGYDLITKSPYFVAYQEKIEIDPALCKIHNKFEYNFNLSDKKFLYRNMKIYYFEQGENIFDYLPVTFHIDKSNSELSEFLNLAHSSPGQLWIVKPGENSNRGSGITVTNKLNLIINELNAVISGEASSTYVVQKYIEKPFLIHKRKFDIRLYTLCTCNNGIFQAYFYQEGYLRTACKVYNTNDMDKFIHLTNDAVQNKCEDYGKWENGNKLSYSDFQRYLDMKKINVGFVETILPNIKKIVIDTVKATWKKLNKDRRILNFEIFGYDFLLDSSLKPWLLEVNTNPCLELSATNLARIIPAMLENAFKIAIDPIFPEINLSTRRQTYRGNNFLSENKFELIFHQDIHN